MPVGSWIRRILVRSSPSGSAARSGSGQAASPAAPEVSDASTPGTESTQWIAFEPKALRRTVVFVLVAVSLWMIAVWAVGATAHFLFLLLLAWLVAAAMEPEIAWLVRHGWRRGLATAATGTAAILVSLGLGAIFGTELAQQITQLATSWPEIVDSAVSWANSTFGLSLDSNDITSNIDLSRLSDWGSTVAQGAFGVLGTLGAVTFDLLTVLVFAFYLAAAGPSLLKSLASWLPSGQQEVFGTVWQITLAKTGGYVISKFVLIVLSAGAHAIVFWAIGLPGWLPLALLAGITAQLIPMVGTYIGVIAAALVALFEDPFNVIWVVAFATVYQQIETYVFTPRVSKRVMDVSAPIALGAVFVGVAIWGPIGAIIGIPIAAAVVSLLETYGRRYQLVSQIEQVGEEGAVTDDAASTG